MRSKLVNLIIIIIILVSILAVYFYAGRQNTYNSTTENTSIENIVDEQTQNMTSNSDINENTSPNESQNETPVDIHGKLSVKGTNIIDKNGNIFSLKGVSTHGIAWFPQYISKETFLTLRDDWGANTVRIAMYSDPNSGYTTRST